MIKELRQFAFDKYINKINIGEEPSYVIKANSEYVEIFNKEINEEAKNYFIINKNELPEPYKYKNFIMPGIAKFSIVLDSNQKNYTIE